MLTGIEEITFFRVGMKCGELVDLQNFKNSPNL